MTARFTLVPFAALAIVSPAQATVYMSLEQALQAIFPGANFTPAFLTPDKAARNAIEKLAGSSLSGNEIKIWRVSGSGWLIADQAVGRHDYIPFVLGLDDKGAIKGLEILEYRESYGGQVREAAWRAQFNGKRQGASLVWNKDVLNISGATLSTRHLTDAVKRLLALYAVLLAKD